MDALGQKNNAMTEYGHVSNKYVIKYLYFIFNDINMSYNLL